MFFKHRLAFSGTLGIGLLLGLLGSVYGTLSQAEEVPVIEAGVAADDEREARPAVEMRPVSHDTERHDETLATEQAGSLEQRFERLEKQVHTRSEVDALQKVDELQKEIKAMKAKKSTDEKSYAVLNAMSPSSLHKSKRGLCHSQGVDA